MKFVEGETQGRLVLGEGYLYGAINNLLEKGWIRTFDDGTGRKKEYILTETGKTVAESELERLRELTKIATEIIGGNIK